MFVLAFSKHQECDYRKPDDYYDYYGYDCLGQSMCQTAVAGGVDVGATVGCADATVKVVSAFDGQ